MGSGATKGERVLTTEQLRKSERNVKWERRFQSVMLSLVAAAIVWGITTLINVDKTQAIVLTRLDMVEIRQAGAIERREADRYHTDLHKRLDSTDSAIVIIDGRLKVIEVIESKRKKLN